MTGTGLLPFEPHPLARGCHAQTILGAKWPWRRQPLDWRRHELVLPDGDVICLRSLEGRTGVVVSLFHGLAGSADAVYVHRAAEAFSRLGHAVVAVNHRGSGEGEGRAARIYHSGSSADVAAVTGWIQQRFPQSVHLAIGYSLSANMLLLLRGRDRHLPQPDAVIAVVPPVDLAACARRMDQGFNMVYEYRFVRELVAQVRRRMNLGLVPAMDFPAWLSLPGFDDCYTARDAGFRDRHDYYANCSSAPWLRDIEAPTVILAAEDDPLAPGGDLRTLPLGPGVRLHLERHGGHMGFVNRRKLPDGSHRWLEHALVALSQDLLPGV